MSNYENHNLEDRDLPFIYKERTARPTGRMFGSSNWHENIEIIYVRKGNGAISNNGHTLPLTCGDVAVINTNHLHALAAGDCEMQYRYLIVDRAFCLSNGIDSSSLSFDTLIHDARLRDLMEDLHAAYELPEDTFFRTLCIRAHVLNLILFLCKSYGTTVEEGERSERSVSHIKQAIAYIRASYDKDFSLEDVASFVGVNKCYLSREFHKYTGYTFVAYVNRTRCIMAQQLLRDERFSVSEVGSRCGFENPSYFARSFQRYIGMRPGEYRNFVLKTGSK